jgi:hypothetical protein
MKIQYKEYKINVSVVSDSDSGKQAYDIPKSDPSV